jgi:Acyclic terpene utilisation family protein AtuA
LKAVWTVEINYMGDVYLAKAEGSGGELSVNTYAEKLLYENADPLYNS